MKHDCPNCYYRNSSWVGGIEISASCDHPNFLPEGKVLYPDQLQSPDWCPLAEDDRIISELHAQAVREYQQAFNKIAESGFDHHRKLDEAEDNDDP